MGAVPQRIHEHKIPPKFRQPRDLQNEYQANYLYMRYPDNTQCLTLRRPRNQDLFSWSSQAAFIDRFGAERTQLWQLMLFTVFTPCWRLPCQRRATWRSHLHEAAESVKRCLRPQYGEPQLSESLGAASGRRPASAASAAAEADPMPPRSSGIRFPMP